MLDAARLLTVDAPATEVIIGAPVTLCAYDKNTRRAVLYFAFAITGPSLVRSGGFDDGGTRKLEGLEIGTYVLKWMDPAERSKTFVVDAEKERTIVVEVDASSYPPRVLGGPSPCAPK